MLSRPRSGEDGGRGSGTASGGANSASGSVCALCGGVGAPKAGAPTSVGATVSHLCCMLCNGGKGGVVMLMKLIARIIFG